MRIIKRLRHIAAALALALKGDPERICHRVSRGYRHNSRKLNRQNI